MNKELLDFILSIPDDNYQEFIKASTIKLQLDSQLETITSDYSWLDVIERYSPFIKNAIDNPFQELLELTDSKKLYENRFLVSLILKLNSFLKDEYKILLERMISSKKKSLKINGKTLLDNEEIEIKLEISSRDIKGNDKAYGLTVKERLERIIELIDSLIKTSFFKSIKDATLVKSPIHRSNVILEDQNFKKMLELWGFLENYILLQKTLSSKKLQTKKDDELKESLLNNYYVSYRLLSNTIDEEDKNEEFYKDYLEHLITRLVEDSTMDEKSFKKIINKKFEEEYLKKKNREKNIHAIFIKSMDNYQKQVKDAIRALK